jgi:TRAP-type transport system periplasmic protein
MRVARRTFLASAMATVAAPAVIRLAAADASRVTLKLHHDFSAVSCVHDRFLAPWARRIETDSGGRLRVDIFPSMQLGGQPAQLYDQARDGIVDIVWAAPSDTPGRFAKIEVFELPFVAARRAVVNSRAIEDYAAADLKDEFREVHPICFSCADRGIVHTNRPIRTIEELRGMRLHVRTRLAGEAVRALGAHAVPMPSAQLPLAIAKHVVDGGVDPWHMAPALRLYDLLKAHTDFADASFSTTTFVLAMNKASYDRLSRELKTVIDDNSGQRAAGMAGAMWDLEAAAVADLVVQRGDPIDTLLPDAVEHWRRVTEPVVDTWQKQMKEHKVDGERLIADAQAVLQKYANEPEPQPPQPTPPPQPEQKVVAQPAQSPQAKVDGAAGTVDALAAPSPPVAKPAPTAGSPLKELDIPL